MLRRCPPILAALLLCAPAPGKAAVASAGLKSQAVSGFFDEHCVDCHGPDSKKGGLRLDTLKDDLTAPGDIGLWTRIHDRIASGEMPPPKRDRPAPAAVKSVTDSLSKKLHSASLAQQQTQGRVVLRRLNGTEYENTMRSLVGTNVSLKPLLPEDNSSGGFDNVSAALEVSATHLLVYQDAAEKAVRSAVPFHPPLPFHERRTGREMSEKGANFRQTLSRTCTLKDDALIIYGRLPRYGLACTPNVPGTGRYKIRMSVAAVGADNQPVAAAFMTVDRGREDPVVLTCQDFEPGPPKVVETEVELESGQAFVVNLLSNWNVKTTKKPIEEYSGPGLLIEWLDIEGPVGDFPPASYTNLFGSVPLKVTSVVKAEKGDKKAPEVNPTRSVAQWANDPLIPVSNQPKEDSDRLIRAFVKRAFRRDASESMQKHYVDKVQQRIDGGESFYDAMVFGFKSILSSPHFLTFLEPGLENTTAGDTLTSSHLDGFALANRLSYFLWSAPPDEELLDLARKGTLSSPAQLRSQVERMLNSPLAHRFTENFTGQWLDLRKMNATIPDPNLYGEFDGLLHWSMPLETHSVFEEVLKKDLSLLEFVDSNWSMLNARLALHYGIPDVIGNNFRRVSLPAQSRRGGVMTHGGVLKVTADGTTTSPVLRGKWILERIIGLPPAPPPADIPALEPDIRGASTIRQLLEKHRSTESCNACHQYIDPPGFALESFDPIGGHREFYRASAAVGKSPVAGISHTGRAYFRGPDVEKGGRTATGETFDDITQYKQLLLAQKDQIARNLASKLLVYATGAEIQFADREALEHIVAILRTKNYGFRSLVHEVVQSRPFLNK